MSLFDWFADRRKGQFVGKVSQETEESDGLWGKCPECSQVVYRKDLIANASVCSNCGHHNRINSEERIKLIVDGIPETTPDGQGQVDNLPLGIIDNLTILRGPASALYGNSSGGVIQIKTLSNFDKNFIRFRMQGGSFGYSLAQFIAGWKNDKSNGNV